MNLLKVDNLTVRFGGLTAVSEVSFSVEEGQIYSVIGPNGAGKTTLFNAITGIFPPTEGKVMFRGSEVRRPFGGRSIAAIASAGVVTGATLALAVNLQPMWQSAIVDLYKYRQPFDWWHSIATAAGFLADRPFRDGLLPLLAGLVVGCAGSKTIWNRSSRSPEVSAQTGISRTFQNIRLFQQMTVLDNVLVGMDRTMQSSFLDAAFRLPRHFRERRACTARAMEILEIVELSDAAHLEAAKLSYGHQRRLEIARALASDPKLLLLDEPAAGMNPSETVDLMDLIRKIRDRGVTVLLIEHHMRVVMGISNRIVVLDYGHKIAEGTPQEIQSNPRVIEAYLGKQEV